MIVENLEQKKQEIVDSSLEVLKHIQRLLAKVEQSIIRDRYKDHEIDLLSNCMFVKCLSEYFKKNGQLQQDLEREATKISNTVNEYLNMEIH